MRFIKMLSFFLLLPVITINSQPKGNPIATFYDSVTGYPGWTDEIAWDNVIDMSVYANGTGAFEKFENARDELYNEGGGVLYYPKGTYDFDVVKGPSGRGLMLKKGVVIRGETPVSDAYAITADSSMPGLSNLETVFSFTFKNTDDGEVPWMWNCIGTMPGTNEELHEVDKVGIVWVNVIGAYVYMGPNMNWDSTWDQYQSHRRAINEWKHRIPDGTHPMDPVGGAHDNSPFHDHSTPTYKGAGSKRLVFGCRFDHCTMSNWGLDDYSNGAIDDSTYYYGGYRHGSRINIHGSNVLVANNVISKSDKNFYYEQLTYDRKVDDTASVNTVLFDYGKIHGINVNKELVDGLSNRCDFENGPYYEKNIIIRDNWVYNHGNCGYYLTGKWMVVQNNVNYRDYLDEDGSVYGLPGTYELTLCGYLESTPIDDNNSRAFDVGGWNIWMDGNWYTGTGSTPGNDGEGILCQRFGGFEVFSWAFTHNSQGNTGENSYMGPYDTHVMGLLVFKNQCRGNFGLINHKIRNTAADLSVVGNTGGSQVISGDGTVLDGINTCPGKAVTAPDSIEVVRDTQNKRNIITWRDRTTNAIGFRVDRKIENSDWHTIAYRPRNETGGVWLYDGREYDGDTIPGCVCSNQIDFNKQKWVDYTAPPGKNISYRVVAINCDDDESGASSTVQITRIEKSQVSNHDDVMIYPNPSAGSFTCELPDEKAEWKIQLSRIDGKLIMEWHNKNGIFTFGDDLNAGLYIVSFISEDDIIVKKLIKEN